MPRLSAASLAQHARDAGLVRQRRLTWYCGIGAAAITAVASMIAATTIPGHSQTSTQQSTPSSISDNTPANPVPEQALPPVPGSGDAPVVVSGGS